MRVASCIQSKRGATGASGAAARWHPYPTNPQLPCFSASASTTVPIAESFHIPPPKPLSAHALAYQKERVDGKRAQQDKFESKLKNFAVNRLAEIWKDTSYVINSAYGSSNYTQAAFPMVEKPTRYNPQHLLSPETPSLSPGSSYAFQERVSPSDARNMPLRAFVHDVLRRSRTMWPAVQVALCYLDALRDKVPDAIAEVNKAEGLQVAEAALDSLFGAQPSEGKGSLAASNPALNSVTQLVSPPSSEDGENETNQDVRQGPDAMATASADAQERARRTRRRRIPPVPATPLPPRPSPLLCPRRMFVAALILACKFTQDRVYSNRAWARISGLEPREISRCERALGEALDWRLWVGKGLADEPTAFLRNFLLAEENQEKPSVFKGSSVLARSLSDSSLLTPGSWAGSPFAASPDLVPPQSNSRLGRSSSLNAVDFLDAATPMLNGGNSFTMTPANADLDAMDFEQQQREQGSGRPMAFERLSSSGSFTNSPTCSVRSLTSNEYSFIPTAGIGMLSPPPSQCISTPENLALSQRDDEFDLLQFVSTPVGYGVVAQPTPGFDPVLRTPLPSGIERTFDTGKIHSVDFNVAIDATPNI